MTNQWVWSPLVVSVMLGNWGGKQSVMLGMPCMITVVVHEQSSPHATSFPSVVQVVGYQSPDHLLYHFAIFSKLEWQHPSFPMLFKPA
jgi:hypothetical protein